MQHCLTTLDGVSSSARQARSMTAWSHAPTIWRYLNDRMHVAKMWKTSSIGFSSGDLVGRNTMRICMAFHSRSSTMSASPPVWIEALSIIKMSPHLNQLFWSRNSMNARNKAALPLSRPIEYATGLTFQGLALIIANKL
jgi:hypothetical protein